MPQRYELIYGFVHCRGRTTYCVGYADSREDAEAWVKNHRDGLPPKIKIPPEDPVRYCRAAWCPFKKQKPWFDMRPSQKPEDQPMNTENKD